MTTKRKTCGAQHPTEDITCVLPVGTNAYNDERDENVHVHRAQIGEARFNWEDVK